MKLWITLYFAIKTLAPEGSLEKLSRALAEAPPATPEAAVEVDFPAPGRHSAAAIFALVEQVSGKRVHASSFGLGDTMVRIRPALAGTPASIESLRVLLEGHGVYLFLDEKRIPPRWLASQDRRLLEEAEEPPRLTRAYVLKPALFNRAVKEINRFISEKNEQLPPEAPRVRAVPIPATGRIIVRSHSERILRIIDELVRGIINNDEPPADSVQLYVYQARYDKVSEIYNDLLEYLSEEEVKQIRVVFPRRTNSVWIRTVPPLWAKIDKLLKVLDTKARKRPSTTRVRKTRANTLGEESLRGSRRPRTR